MVKKLLSTLLVLTMSLSFACIASAQTLDTVNLSEFDDEIIQCAYMDIETASVEQQQKILDARAIIINNSSWVADDANAYIVDDETREIISVVPKFHDIFPDDWELPIVEVPETMELSDISDSIMPTWTGYAFYMQEVELTRPSDDQITNPFATFSGRNGLFYVSADSIPGQTYNFGFSNHATRRSVFSQVNIQNGTGVLYETSSGITYGCRASTYSTEGTARFTGSYAQEYYNLDAISE